jgi:hypothetical protein
VTAPWSVEFHEDVLVLVHDDVIEVLADDDLRDDVVR